ncbi:MAG: M28 family peptidase [Undibacterium sp.]|nr:M28 family peptidase [Undibacterium sp.]
MRRHYSLTSFISLFVLSLSTSLSISSNSYSQAAPTTPVSSTNASNTLSSAMRDVQALASEKMQGRSLATPGNALAQDYILSRIKELGLKPCGDSYLQGFSYTDRTGTEKKGQNILACQDASNPSSSNNNAKIVVSAHYDHLGVKNGALFFGADDNASGVAGVFAVAKKMQTLKPQHPIVYAFFDGEELGLVGSNAFVKQALIPLDQIAININFDMIARGDKNELYFSGSHQTPSLQPLLTHLNGTQGIKLLFGHDRPEQGQDDWTNQSDQYAFFKAGIPHLYVGVEDHADYHKPSDTFDKINPKFFDGAIAIVQEAVHLIDQALTKNDFRIERKKYDVKK